MCTDFAVDITNSVAAGDGAKLSAATVTTDRLIMTTEQQKLVGREFRHFKGNLYRLEGFAKDSETLEEMVVYRALYGDGGLWVRPAKMFFETIERDGKTMKRFELLEDAK